MWHNFFCSFCLVYPNPQFILELINHTTNEVWLVSGIGIRHYLFKPFLLQVHTCGAKHSKPSKNDPTPSLCSLAVSHIHLSIQFSSFHILNRCASPRSCQVSFDFFRILIIVPSFDAILQGSEALSPIPACKMALIFLYLTLIFKLFCVM